MSNLELFRIIAMLLIVAHHYVVNSGLLEFITAEPTSLRAQTYLWFGIWGKTGINCFMMITGYFMCKSKITIKKFVKLLFQKYFYNIGIFTIFLLAGYEHYSDGGLTYMILSVIIVFTLCIIIDRIRIILIENRILPILWQKRV